MKIRRLWAFFFVICLLSMTSCSAVKGPQTEEGDPSSHTNILIAYFSRVGNTDFPDGVDAISSASLLQKDGELVGNTLYIASLIQQANGGDLFLIQTEVKYPAVYEEIDQQGGEEHQNGVRPKLATHIENMDDYDIIFLGYPIWYYDLPMAVYSFLEEYDLAGKTIIPFVTSGASGFTGTLDTIRELQPDARICTKGFDVKHANVAAVTEDDVNEWLDGLPVFEKLP